MFVHRNLILVVSVAVHLISYRPVVAEDVSPIGNLRQWAADVIGVDATEDPARLLRSKQTPETPASIFETFKQKMQGLLYQAGQLAEQRIGWLRPTNVKELALIWVAAAFALPWAFVSWLAPILRHDVRPVRWIVVGLWTSLALWIAWITWGAPSGSDRFASTMLIGLPLLLLYFNCVASSIATPAKS